MSMNERTGFRSLVYSAWHRPASTARFVGKVAAAKLKAVDIDWCEACAYCSAPVALIETERTTRTSPKNAPITALLARMAGIRAFSVAYSGQIDRHHCDTCGSEWETGEPAEFVVRQIEPAEEWNHYKDAQGYTEFLRDLRNSHQCN